MKIKKVIIGKGEMPECCIECEHTGVGFEGDYCNFTMSKISWDDLDVRNPDCPLEEVSDE
jgi:hypothetical protein